MFIPNCVREVALAIKTWEPRAVLEQVTFAGNAPHIAMTLHWRVADAVAGEVYRTDLLKGRLKMDLSKLKREDVKVVDDDLAAVLAETVANYESRSGKVLQPAYERLLINALPTAKRSPASK